MTFNGSTPHSFHIPVMGTGFTVDTPIRVAKYGISSVISIIDDVLTEQMRKKYSELYNEPYERIGLNEKDGRSRRITAYLNLVDKIVTRQSDELQASSFGRGSELTRYYEMLPESPLKDLYQQMRSTTDESVRIQLQNQLRDKAIPGNIDVNIMTKVDHSHLKRCVENESNPALAQASLRGFALSNLRSSVVFSAGFNSALYSYTSTFDDFFPDANGEFKKKIILKVSDFRSAEIQGKFLAKKGLWISEYRIESGLNCGGHAFGMKGNLIGPILEDFRNRRQELTEKLFGFYNKAIKSRGFADFTNPPPVRVTVQGGINNSGEHNFLHDYFKVDSTGWGSPFLLVPEAVCIDSAHLKKLARADENDVHMSNSSPMGVPFWNLLTSDGEEHRKKLIEQGRPGSGCPKGFLTFEKDSNEQPVCAASKEYQEEKIYEVKQKNLAKPLKDRIIGQILEKACLCRDLAGSALQRHNISGKAKSLICAGPNIINFSKIATLKEMVDHIYGRISLIKKSTSSNMFLTELKLNIEHFRKEISEARVGLLEKTSSYFQEFSSNLHKGIGFYKDMIDHFKAEKKEQFINRINELKDELTRIIDKHSAQMGLTTA